MKITPKTAEDRALELKQMDAAARKRQPAQVKHAKLIESQIEEYRNRASTFTAKRQIFTAKGAKAAKFSRKEELKRGKI